MEFIGRGAGTRMKRERIFFITGAKRRFQKIDQRKDERKSANEKGSDIFYNWSEAKDSICKPEGRAFSRRNLRDSVAAREKLRYNK